MPSYEVFTSPIYNKTEGIVYSSRPLNYNGGIIDDFYLKFDSGRVVEYDAKVGKDILKGIIETDEYSCYLGEAALVEDNSPISNLNVTFKTTLIDENASCHLALGAGFPECVKNGTKDTLLIDVTDSDSLNSDMYWDLHSKDTIVLMSEDTTSVYIHGNKVVIYNFYRVLPGTVSRGFWPIYSDSFYVYTIKWNVVRNYTLKEIRQKKLYDRTVVEKNKIDNHMFEYKSYEQ